MQFFRLNTRQEVQSVISQIARFGSPVALDTETTGLEPHKDKLLDIVICAESDIAYSFSPEYVNELCYLNSHNDLILHNFKFDFHFLYLAGIDLLNKHRIYDTMLMHHLWNENKPHALDAIVQELWQDNYKEVFWSKYKTYDDATPDDRFDYACRDVIYTRKLFSFLAYSLETDGIPESLVDHVHALARALYKTEIAGLKLDMEYLTRTGSELQTKIERAKIDLRDAAPAACLSVELDEWAKEIAKYKTPKKQASIEKPEINFDSSQQLKSLLYDKLRLKKQTNQKTKSITTDDSALTALQNAHRIIPLLQEYRGNQKVFTAFIGGTLEKQFEGRIYPSFNINGTVTGRISSSNPNMQQLPRDGGVRGMYVPDPLHRLITCDYAQLEIVLAAHFSNDPVMLEIVTSGKSMHDHTASAIWGKDFTKEHRQYAKTINFLCIYGGTEYRLSTVLGCSFDEAKRILATLWETYQGLKSAIDECHEKVKYGIPIINPFGRRRRFPEGLQGKELQRAQRQGFNALVQGTGADLTHWAFTQVSLNAEKEDIGKALFPVHDELVTMPKENCCERMKEMLQYYMIHAGVKFGLRVPLSVDCSEPLKRWEK